MANKPKTTLGDKKPKPNPMKASKAFQDNRARDNQVKSLRNNKRPKSF